MRTSKYRVNVLIVVALACGVAGQVFAQDGTGAKGKPAPGLLAWWKFDDGKGAVAKDSSGRGNHGKTHNPEWVKGKFGVALRFNGENAYVSVPAIDGLDGSNQMTVEVWVFWEGMGRYPNIITGGNWNPGGFLVFASDDSCSFRMGKPGKEPWTLGKNWQEVGATLIKPFDLGRWYHLAATFDRPAITTYVDGKPVGSASWNFPVGQSGDIQVGRWGLDQGKTQSHCGLIDELKIYKRALTADEVKASFELEAAKRK